MLFFLERIKRTILFVLLVGSLGAETVEIVSNMYTEEILSEPSLKKAKAYFHLQIKDLKDPVPMTTTPDKVKRFVVFNINHHLEDLKRIPSEKKVLFVMEPDRISRQEAERYSRVYTWDDEVVDNLKFFKFYFPDLLPINDPLPSFEERKLCSMVVRNWEGPYRRTIVEFFLNKPKGEFEFYGSPCSNLSYNKHYKGRIVGRNCGQEKIDNLKSYRFCFCFENSSLKGYITEKIFPCFAAGCVPIYWGAPNITDYIPQECFINYRDFENNDALYEFLKGMSKEVYDSYLENIRRFLETEQAQLFSAENFSNILYEAIVQEAQ